MVTAFDGSLIGLNTDPLDAIFERFPIHGGSAAGAASKGVRDG